MKPFCLVAMFAGAVLFAAACSTETEPSNAGNGGAAAAPKTSDPEPAKPARKHEWDLTEAEWKARLTPEQYYVCREKGTERAGTGEYNKFYEKGKYACVACGFVLFGSDSKYDSKSGWPSFWKPFADGRIQEEEDNTLFMKRTEVLCKRCGSHLGHVFDDGPDPTGLRYCINSVSLKFLAAEDGKKETPPPDKK